MITVVELQREDQSLVDAAFSYLMRHEATHCLQIGLFIPFANGSNVASRWWVALDNGVVAGVASHTEPYNLILSMVAAEGVVEAISASLGAASEKFPGVIGPKPGSLDFSEVWASHNQVGFELDLNEAVYECTEVIFPDRMEGTARFANETDIPWMAPWVDQFFDDAGMVREGADSTDFVTRRMQNGGFVLWLDEAGQVVSLAGYANQTPSGMRVGPVYTPTEHRGHGYGVSVSAAVTQHLLDSGRTSVFLFADLDYPVSNHVYKKIGYKPVAEFGVYRFNPSS